MIDAKLDAEARVEKRPESGPPKPNPKTLPQVVVVRTDLLTKTRMCQNRTSGARNRDDGMGDEAARLRELRNRNDLTQEQLAFQSGIDRDKIAKIEIGARRMSAADAVYLSQALRVRVDDLVGRPAAKTHFRLSDPSREEEARVVAEWFEEYVRDVFFLERSAKRHGLA